MNKKIKNNHLETPNKHLFSISKQSLKKNHCFLIHYNAIIYENKSRHAPAASFFFFFFFFFLQMSLMCVYCWGGGGDCPPKPKNNSVHASNQSSTMILSTQEWSVTWHWTGPNLICIGLWKSLRGSLVFLMLHQGVMLHSYNLRLM